MKKYMYNSPIQKLSILLLINLLFFQLSVLAQNRKPVNTAYDKPPAHEVAEGEYQGIQRSSLATSPAYQYDAPGFFVVQVNVNADGENMLGDASNEPSIAVDPTDPSNMAIGWRHFETVNNSFRQAGNGYTTDGGQTWTFPEVINPGIFRSDPVLGADSQGNFYYNSLTVDGNDYYCDVYKSDNGGNTWDDGTFAYGGDKQWMTIDQSGGEGDGNIYAYWTSSYSFCDPNFFTRSTDGGVSYEDCISIPGNPYWGTTTVDAQGRLYVGGSNWNGFQVERSSNAQNAGQPISWDVNTNVDLDGVLVGFGGYVCPNPNGLLGQTSIDVDRSGGAFDGNVYLLASVERGSINDPCDVMFSKSTDGGLSWSTAMRINDDVGTTAYQWFGTMSVAPTGRIDVIWLDTRDNPGDVNSALYYAYSLDAGETWAENVKLSESFDPHLGWPQQDKMGDYFDLVSDENGASLAWAATFNGEQDVYFSYIDFGTVGIAQTQQESGSSLSQNYPNPFNGTTIINYKLDEAGTVKLKITDMTGRVVSILVDENQSAGLHKTTFNSDGLDTGIYFYRLEAGKYPVTKKMTIIH